jgi:DNA-binding NarL/FixJ family response regulator
MVAESERRGHRMARRAAARELKVATELGVSPRTVERHVTDILERWGLGSRTALARAWLEAGE